MGFSTLRGAAVAAVGLLALGAVPTAHAGSIGLAPHRAIYDLVLDRSAQSGDLADMTGRIVMEFTGSPCGGYNVALRFRTEIFDWEGDLRVTDARTTTFEDGAGKAFRFTNQTFIDDTLAEESRGKASRSEQGITVSLTRPGEKNFVLDDSVVFPTEQILQIIEAGQRNQHFLQIDVYDGAEDGETVYATTVIIGDGSSSGVDVGDELAVREAGVAALRHWPVSVSYFDQREPGEQIPIYVMSFILYENGISRQLKLDYGDFVIAGRLVDLEMLAGARCR